MMTTYWKVVHYEWEIDKAIYNLMTAVALYVSFERFTKLKFYTRCIYIIYCT